MLDIAKINNMDLNELYDLPPAQVVFADYMYEDSNFSWAEKYWSYLKKSGIFMAMTDWHTNHRYRVFMEDVLGATLVNDAVWLNEWGNHPKDRFHQCFDNIIIYTNVKSGWKFYSDRIQVPKATVGSKGLNPSGRNTKTATAWIDGITLTTVAKERVKTKSGKLARHQKPLKLYDRIIKPFSDEGDFVLDIFMGVGTLGKWCKNNNRNYFGIEYDDEKFDMAEQNIFGID